MPEIDFNSDLGEGFSIYRAGDDAAILPHLTSANIACGFHAGDSRSMRSTVALAAKLGVAVGAHPGFDDLQGFGRRMMTLSEDEVYELIVYQVGALLGFTKAANVELRHVKPHGALYNFAAVHRPTADAICRAVKDVDPGLILFGLSGSALVTAAEHCGLSVAQEVFADRSYQEDGTLTPRGQPGAMIESLHDAIDQVMNMLHLGEVRTPQGIWIPVKAHTLCIHGDQPGAAAFASAIRQALLKEGITIQKPARRNNSERALT
ncbi:LamB/YcsF family protein [Pseudomonas sp. B21-010]|uniref:LamB/YcsF family protein n=1 Tax=Pseudomonas sp. B21-010 TaxID=2895471 RepID=UPI0021604817|nr:5-oxoprolinase subunit PxpA [Pseudomonas sp. B21-010]UVM63551.1 LamB/YcsF family protein [Pseudomonas sp. B21-010]